MNKEEFETQCKLLCEYCCRYSTSIINGGHVIDYNSEWASNFSGFLFYPCKANSLRYLYNRYLYNKELLENPSLL